MAQLLLVDDDPGVLYVTSRMLASFGHRVLLAFGGLASLETFKLHHPTIEAVLMDVDMPDMDGIVAFHMIRHQSPEMPVVFVTGSGGLIPEEVRRQPGVATLSKPFRLHELASALDLVLNNGRGSAPTHPAAGAGWSYLDPPATDSAWPAGEAQ